MFLWGRRVTKLQKLQFWETAQSSQREFSQWKHCKQRLLWSIYKHCHLIESSKPNSRPFPFLYILNIYLINHNEFYLLGDFQIKRDLEWRPEWQNILRLHYSESTYCNPFWHVLSRQHALSRDHTKKYHKNSTRRFFHNCSRPYCLHQNRQSGQRSIWSKPYDERNFTEHDWCVWGLGNTAIFTDYRLDYWWRMGSLAR